jgi:predicted RNA-binding protein
MCMATAYMKRGSEKEVILQEVAFLQPKGDSMILKPLFGEQKSIKAIIKEIDFLNSTIIFEKMEEAAQ